MDFNTKHFIRSLIVLLIEIFGITYMLIFVSAPENPILFWVGLSLGIFGLIIGITYFISVIVYW